MRKKKKLVVWKRENSNGKLKMEIGNYKILLFLLFFFAVSIGVFSLTIEPKTTSPATPAPAPTTYNLLPTSSLFLPVLVYHHIGTPLQKMTSAEKSFFIEPEWFEKHLQYLAQHNFKTVRFSDIADYFSRGTPIPERAVIISFDDGWKSAVEWAYPLLQKYNMTATVFIPTKLIAEKPGKGMRMSWNDLVKLRDAGWEIGSHSLWHPYLTKSRKVKLEVEESKKILEEKLGISVTTFAYPFGASNEQIEKTVRETGYSTARSYTSGSGITRENLFHIPVVKVYANVGLGRWEKQLFGGSTPSPHTPLSPY